MNPFDKIKPLIGREGNFPETDLLLDLAAKTQRIAELESQLATAREVLPKCLAMAEAWESTDGDPAVELIDEIKAALAAISQPTGAQETKP